VRLALLAIAVTGCLRTTAFHCATDSDCKLGGAQGTCELVGFCSFEDPACASGHRFGDLSGNVANQCVGDQTFNDAAPGDGPHDAHIFHDAPPVAFCDSTQTTLVGCWEFEGNLNDASGHNNNGVGTMVTFSAGKVGMAASIAPAGHIAAGDDASLAPTMLTIEAWIHPTTLPGAGARMGVIDNDGSWGLFIIPGGFECATTMVTPLTVTIPTGAWSHVACTYDGSTVHGYFNGVDVGSATGGTALGTGNTNGVAIASNSPSADNLDGLIDQVRVWTAPRTAQQICIAAGLTGC
jgi:hypothetical protein